MFATNLRVVNAVATDARDDDPSMKGYETWVVHGG
jgi:hypothetical protein